MPISETALRAIRDRATLFEFLRDHLRWPVDPEDPYTYAGPALNEELAARAEVRQIVPFTTGDPATIFLVEFATPFRRGDLREILRRIREKIRTEARYSGHALEELVFVCATEDYGGIRFVRFEEQGGRQPRLRSFGFERDAIGETHTLRHTNLPALELKSNVLGEPAWNASRSAWIDAWSVERVTRDFFDDYKRIFGEVRDKHIGTVAGDRQLFTQRLFNRLMFIQFLSKKGWLRFNGDRNYLFALREAARTSSENLYHDRLYWTFFNGLGVLVSPEHHNADMLTERRGHVPYLNGGLFEMVDADDVRGAVTIDNEAFDKIFDGLFARYNFTIAESTPDDQEVAVDPEMLGKVFEELVTGRHESGSYYTPRSVVAFMCREALKGYLIGTTGESPHSIERFVDNYKAEDLSDPERALEALRAFTCVDPACGSGAYLLGMLQELMALRQALFTAKKVDARTLYDRKLEIIQNSIYGVDKDEFAINTARLRLWLSLVVDSDFHPLDNEIDAAKVALPNLDFKIEIGDSLSAPDPRTSKGNLSGETLREFTRTKREYADPRYKGDKSALKRHISELETDIALWEGRPAPEPGKVVDWRVAFAEVFAATEPDADLAGNMNFGGTLTEAPLPGGFDTVLANPPYVRADAQFKHIKDEEARQSAISVYKKYRETLKKSSIYSTLHEKWDLYIPFLERAYQLLAPGGHMIFIIPDAYNANKYAAKSRELFLTKSRIVRIDFCTEVDLFDAGVTNTILHFSNSTPVTADAPVRIRRYAPNRNDFDKYADILATMPQVEFGETLFKASGEKNEAAPLGTVPLEAIFYISAGLVIHADEDDHLGEFGAEDVLSTVPDKDHIRRFVFGKDIIRWSLRNVRFLEWGTVRAPAHFRRPTFSEMHTATEKIVTVRTPGAIPKSIYDDNSLHFDASSIGFIPWHYLQGVSNNSIKKTAKYKHEIKSGTPKPLVYRDELEIVSERFDIKYVLGVMNSKFTRDWLGKQRRSKLHIYPDDWKKLPIAPATPEQQAEIAALVQKCLDAKGVGCEAWEKEIDGRVAALYGL